MPQPRPAGALVPFLAVSGGLGCTGLLASVALLLARGGRRVLAVDLRAAGGGALSRRLLPLLPPAGGAPGLAPHPAGWRAARRPVPLPTDSAGVLHLLGPGPGAEPPPPGALEAALRPHLEGWLREYDVVLIDVGADAAGPQLAAQADRSVLCVGPRHLGLEAALGLRAGLGPAGPPLLPVIGPLHAGPPALRAEWLARIAEQLAPLWGWAPTGAAGRALRAQLQLPDDPRLAWGEGLPLTCGAPRDADSPAGVVATLAALVAAGPGLGPTLAADRVGALAAALGPIEPFVEDVLYDVYVSTPYPQGLAPLSRRLCAVLAASGLRVASFAQLRASSRAAAELSAMRGRARATLLLIGAAEGEPLEEELLHLLRVSEEEGRLLVPVFVGPGAFAHAPPAVARLHGLFLEDAHEDVGPLVAHLLANLRARATPA